MSQPGQTKEAQVGNPGKEDISNSCYPCRFLLQLLNHLFRLILKQELRPLNSQVVILLGEQSHRTRTLADLRLRLICTQQ